MTAEIPSILKTPSNVWAMFEVQSTTVERISLGRHGRNLNLIMHQCGPQCNVNQRLEFGDIHDRGRSRTFMIKVGQG